MDFSKSVLSSFVFSRYLKRIRLERHRPQFLSNVFAKTSYQYAFNTGICLNLKTAVRSIVTSMTELVNLGKGRVCPSSDRILRNKTLPLL